MNTRTHSSTPPHAGLRTFLARAKRWASLFLVGSLLQGASHAQLGSSDESRFQVDAEGTLVAASGVGTLELDAATEPGASFALLFQLPAAAQLLDVRLLPGAESGAFSIQEDPEGASLVHERFAPAPVGFGWHGFRCTFEEPLTPGPLTLDWQLTFSDYPPRTELLEHSFRVFWLPQELGISATLESWQIYLPDESFGASLDATRGNNSRWTLLLVALVLASGVYVLRAKSARPR